MDLFIQTGVERLNKRLSTAHDKFKAKVHTTIADYYGIKDCDCSFKLTRSDLNAFEFEFKFKRLYRLPFIPEINQSIRSYLVEYAVFVITYPLDYPFNAPVWRLKTNNSSSDYSQILENHNCAYTRDWSPAMSFDNDILCMIEKLTAIARKN